MQCKKTMLSAAVVFSSTAAYLQYLPFNAIYCCARCVSQPFRGYLFKMAIKSLKIQNIRNLRQVEFIPSANVNLIHGVNGSGKTSLLEAINFLGLTRSFRTRKFPYFVSREQKESIVFSQLQNSLDHSSDSLGVSRDIAGAVNIRYNGSNIDISQLASLVPLLVINTDTFQILEGSPAIRRQFVDWGSFHADQKLYSCLEKL